MPKESGQVKFSLCYDARCGMKKRCVLPCDRRFPANDDSQTLALFSDKSIPLSCSRVTCRQNNHTFFKVL